MTSYVIDPSSVLDYAWDWTAWLAESETITSHTVTPSDPVGITVNSSSEDAGVVTVWLSGATGRTQRVTIHIITNQGREDDRTITLTVRER